MIPAHFVRSTAERHVDYGHGLLRLNPFAKAQREGKAEKQSELILFCPFFPGG